MSDQSTDMNTLLPALSGDEPDYQWAEYNLPTALLDGIASVDDEDRLAFVSFGIDSGMVVLEGLQ